MTSEIDTVPLIRTKLYRPRITGDLVPRPRLLQHLEERRSRPLTLVVALAVSARPRRSAVGWMPAVVQAPGQRSTVATMTWVAF